jgi:outer membrane protein assembly factor BamA
MKKAFLAFILAGATWLGAQSVTIKAPVIRSVEFKNFRGVSTEEIITRLNDRDIQLVERPYNAQNLQTAQGVVEELLAEKGQTGIQVKQTVTKIQPNSIRVTFTPAN